MNKKHLASFLLAAGLLSAQLALAQGVDLGVADPGTLPTSRFYFLKEFRRTIERVFTFNPVKKAELELNILNEKAAEAKAVEERDPQNADAIKNALENYKSEHDRLQARIKSLQDNFKNPDVDKLLSDVASKTVRHEKLFDELSKKFAGKDELTKLNDENKTKLDELTSTAAEKDDPEKSAERFKKELEDANKDEEDNVKNQAGEQIKEAEEKVNELESKIAKVGSAADTTQAASKLSEAKDHLAKAKAALADKNDGEAFGQARSAEVLAKSGMKMLERGKENKEEKEDSNKKDDNKKEENKSGRETNEINKQAVVTINENGFSPQEVKIKKGGEVIWLNKSSSAVWPASNPHPIHTDYPGFDALRGIANGESYSFTFDKTGSWGYHNHLNPGMRGMVKVED